MTTRPVYLFLTASLLLLSPLKFADGQSRGRNRLTLPTVEQVKQPGKESSIFLQYPNKASVTIDGEPLGDKQRVSFEEYLTPPAVREVNVEVTFADGTKDARKVEIQPGQSIPVNMFQPPVGNPLTVVTQAISPPLSIAMSADSRRFVVGAESGSVVLWDVDAGRPVRTFVGHTVAVNSISMSNDGKRFVTGSADLTAILWDAETGRRLKTYRGHTGPIASVALSQDGRYVLTGSVDRTATLWDAELGKALHVISIHKDEIGSVAFSPDSKTFVTTGLDGKAFLWDSETGEQKFELVGHNDRVYCSQFSRDGVYVCTGSADNTGILWEVATGKPVAQTGRHPVDVIGLVLNPDASRIYLAPRDFVIGVWDRYQRGRSVREFTSHTDAVSALVISQDGKTLLSVARDRSIRIWDLHTGVELACMACDGNLNNWAIGTTDGLFDSSLDGRKLIGYGFAEQLPGTVIDSFSQERYRPGLLTRIMNGERLYLEERMGRSVPPDVRIVPPSETSIGESEVEIAVEVIDRGGGADDVQLFHNGVRRLVPVTKEVSIAQDWLAETEKQISLVTYTFRVTLVPGDNRLLAKVSTGDKSWQAVSAQLEVTNTITTSRKPRLYVVNVDRSGQHKSQQKFWKQHASSNFDRVDMVSVTSGRKSEIESAIADVGELTQPQDSFVIFYRGRFGAAGMQKFVSESGTVGNNADDLLTLSHLGQAINLARATKRAIIIESLDSIEGVDASIPANVQGLADSLAHESGAQILVSLADRAAPLEDHQSLSYLLSAAIEDVPGPLSGRMIVKSAGEVSVSVSDWFEHVVTSGDSLRRSNKLDRTIRRSSQSAGFPIMQVHVID